MKRIRPALLSAATAPLIASPWPRVAPAATVPPRLWRPLRHLPGRRPRSVWPAPAWARSWSTPRATPSTFREGHRHDQHLHWRLRGGMAPAARRRPAHRRAPAPTRPSRGPPPAPTERPSSPPTAIPTSSSRINSKADTKGEGNNAFGASWYAMSPTEYQVTAATPSNPTSSSGGGGGY
jgi:hypothetical protein